MEYIPVFNTAEAQIRYTLQGQQCENVLYFESGVDWTPNLLLDLGNALLQWWGLVMKPLSTDQMQVREVYLTDLSTQTSSTATAVPTAPLVGSDNGNPLSNNVALCVSFRTALRGRSFRGRNYVCGMTDNVISGNYFNPGYVTNVQNAYNDLFSVAANTNTTWVVVSKRFNKVPRPIGVVVPVTSVLVTDNVVDSQRRRLPGRGK